MIGKGIMAGVAVAGLLATPALAQEGDQQPTDSACLGGVQQLDQDYGLLLGHPSVGAQREVRVLREAAAIFARNGNESACENVLAEMRTVIDRQNARLSEEGIDTAAFAAERQDRLASLAKVTELTTAVRASDIIGADVRNLVDDDLGDIDDVVLAPDSNDITHVLIERGGFLGLGGETVAVPWEKLRASQRADMFVVNISSEELEAAPVVDDIGIELLDSEEWVNTNDQFYDDKIIEE